MIWTAFYAPIVDPTHQRVTRIYPWDDLVCMYGLQGGMFRRNNNNNPCRCLEDGERPARRPCPDRPWPAGSSVALPHRGVLHFVFSSHSLFRHPTPIQVRYLSMLSCTLRRFPRVGIFVNS
jgi:hypothetical protein